MFEFSEYVFDLLYSCKIDLILMPSQPRSYHQGEPACHSGSEPSQFSVFENHENSDPSATASYIVPAERASGKLRLYIMLVVVAAML